MGWHDGPVGRQLSYAVIDVEVSKSCACAIMYWEYVWELENNNLNLLFDNSIQ